MSYNFLFLVADDLFSYRRFLKKDRVWGHAPFGIEVPLPGLERLEARSVVFDRAYCTVPVCGPSRAAVMSGYSPAHTGILANDSDWKDILRPEHIWTYQIRRKGYHMSTVGKVFHSYRPQPGGVYSALYDCEQFKMVWYPKSEPKEHGGMYGRGWDGDEHNYYDANVADTTIDFLNSYDGSLPFWHEAGFHHPHVPFYAPNRIFDSINLDEIIMPEDWKLGWDLLPFTATFWSGNALGTQPAEWTTEQIDYWRKTVRNYIANVMWMDEQLNRILDGLGGSPHKDNTIITFYSDHGYHLADKGHWHKFTLWEECCAAPMMVSVPGAPAQVIEEPVSMMDLGPTCLDYAGADIRPHHKGQSLRPIIEGGSLPDRLIPTFWFGSIAAAINDFRLVLLQDGSAEFYNIVDDPWQIKNLAGKHPKFDEYRQLLIELASEWGFQIVEEQAEAAPGTPFASYLGIDHTIDQTGTRFIAMGDVQVRARTPGYIRMWGTPENDDKPVQLPEHVSEYSLMSATRASTLHIKGNLRSNTIKLGRVAKPNILLELGDGDDKNSPSQSFVEAHGGRGNDFLRAGKKGGLLFGGPGNDSLLGNNRSDTLDAGAGNDTLDGGLGDDTFYSGTGTSEIHAETGNNVVVIQGGQNTIYGGNGKNCFIFYRTGLCQHTFGLGKGDVIDLSDWAGIRPIRVIEIEGGIEVSAGMERLIFHKANKETVKNAISLTPHTPEQRKERRRRRQARRQNSTE